MSRLLALLVGICLLRRGPQDLPYSLRLTQGLLLLAIGVDLLAMRLIGDDPNALGRGVLTLGLLLLLPWILLGLRQRRARYVQTLAAFLGSGLLFTLVFLPLALYNGALPPLAEGAKPAPGQLLAVGLMFVLVGWKLAINGHIWCQALDWPRALGLPFALLLFFSELALVRAWFPALPVS